MKTLKYFQHTWLFLFVLLFLGVQISREYRLLDLNLPEALSSALRFLARSS